jgi:FixJ family two-component response regulator
MPKLSGRELAQQMVQRRPGLKVLFMSGYTDSAVTNTDLPGHEVAFLPKPFTPAALAQKVREVLEAGGSRLRHAVE